MREQHYQASSGLTLAGGTGSFELLNWCLHVCVYSSVFCTFCTFMALPFVHLSIHLFTSVATDTIRRFLKHFMAPLLLKRQIKVPAWRF